MHIFFAFTGFVLLVAGFIAFRYVRRTIEESNFSKSWRGARIITFILGVAVGIGFLAFSYYPSSGVRIVGFPFLAAVFELHNGNWVDFVGLITLPAAIGNFIAGFFVPQLLFAPFVRRKERLRVVAV